MYRGKNQLPSYRLHKPSGQAVVTLSGRDVYLGLHGTQISRDAYDRAVSEWLAAGRTIARTPTAAISVVELVNGFRKGASIPASQADSFKAVMSLLVRLYGRTDAADFGPLALKAVRQQMIAAGWNRRTINDRVHVARRIFRWGVEHEMLSANVVQALDAVPGLREGQSEAPEPEAVEPVAVEHVDACLPHMPATVADMVRLQMFTGMRAGELVIMRGRDIDTSGATWVYRPAQHKTKHKGKLREVPIGPKARAVLERHLKPELDAFIFSPADSERQRRAEAHAKRKTPLSTGNRPGTNASVGRTFADHYDVRAYRTAIYRACDIAFPPPTGLRRAKGEDDSRWRKRLGKQWAALLAWRERHRWHPHQLRHTFATEARRRFGLEHTQRALGHTHANVTQVYAAVALEKAIEVAVAIG